MPTVLARNTIRLPLMRCLSAPTPVQSSTPEVLSDHPEYTVTSEDDPNNFGSQNSNQELSRRMPYLQLQ
ncbi:hypothetical protein Tco_0620597, partial [Tanacetum coccineum]